MTAISPKAGIAGIAAAALIAGGGLIADHTTPSTGGASGWPYWAPQGFHSQIALTDISGNTPMFSSVFPQVAVDPADPDVVAVAWRQYTLPVDVTADKGQNANCHVSVSTDGGATFTDTDLMPGFRTSPAAQSLDLWYCNAPWATFGPDGTLYAGGSVYTAGPNDLPKQGRVMLTVSHDEGKTWSPGTWGIDLSRFAPGEQGLNGGTAPEDTPWDGANGFVDQQTGTVYTESTSNGSYIVGSNDHGATFGTVHQPSVPGWVAPTHQAVGTPSSAFGVLAVPVAASATPDPSRTCPCLSLWTSTDEGTSYTAHFVAPASDFDATGTVRFPISAADPRHRGHYAIAVYTPDHLLPKVYHTEDFGRTWHAAVPTQPKTGGTVVQANQVGIGYSTTGRLLVTWRGFYRQAGSFATFAAMLGGSGRFGSSVVVSPEPSVYPALTYLGNYGVGNGVGDFTTWITANSKNAFVAFPYAPDGLAEDTDVARIPLSLFN
ncbi:MAG TPA: sialidase family protein [Pseudonocardiaceae bacterium]|jgi:hypothetical protein|nr:sialidase family protein [Pseudonocardiaceae bacterium]